MPPHLQEGPGGLVVGGRWSVFSALGAPRPDFRDAEGWRRCRRGWAFAPSGRLVLRVFVGDRASSINWATR